MTKYLQSDWSRAWAARPGAAMDVWLGSLAAVLSLDETGKLPCSSPRTGGEPLLAGQSAAAQARRNDLVVRDGERLEYVFAEIKEERTHLHITTRWHCYVRYSDARKERQREPFCDGGSINFTELRFREPWIRAARK